MNRKEWQRLRPQVLRRIKPSASLTRRAQDASRRLSARALQAARRDGLSIRPVNVGSIAKDTHLRVAPDIDLFLLFPPATSREELERMGVRLGKRLLSAPRLRYAEHPYVHGRFAGFQFDVVPAYDVPHGRGRLSAVDRSPFHAEYVRKHLAKKRRDEVRILKAFLKGIGCYGAETQTGGFSGYLAELLILKFGDFWDTLAELAKRRPPVRLALDGASTDLGGDLVFVDPVDESRNAAAAVTRERLDLFLRAAKAFVREPRLGFFWPGQETQPKAAELALLAEKHPIVALELPMPSVREDARLPHLRRVAQKFTRWWEDQGFRVLATRVEALSPRRALLLWRHEPRELDPIEDRWGPPAEKQEHAKRFRDKWEKHPEAVQAPRIEDGRWRVTVLRRLREPRRLLEANLEMLLQGADLSRSARQKARVLTGDEVAARASTRKALARALSPKETWER